MTREAERPPATQQEEPAVVQDRRAVMWRQLVLVGEEAHPSVLQPLMWCLLILVSELQPSVVQGCRAVGEELQPLVELDPLVLVKDELHLVVLAREELQPSVPQDAVVVVGSRLPAKRQEQPVVTPKQ